ncbi:eukaryotic translation initiation factor 3 subunit E [Orbilia ellipsospora]|uniref:Eukaryotic translation initiation factor 3 subunit E n=1 Tax=Orbilia ellipsospora TaxID=2528407 RepID=A0AAV9WUT1_9PEZI
MSSEDPQAPAAAGVTAEGISIETARKYDLTPKIMSYLDRHLIFHLLAFVRDQQLYPAEELLQNTYDLLEPTNMTDYLMDLWKQLHGEEAEVPREFLIKREKVGQEWITLQNETAKITELLENPDVISNFRSDKMQNLQFLKDNHGVTDDMIDALLRYGQGAYSRGSYAQASDILYSFRILSTDSDKVNQATWGKLACEILTVNWEGAMEEIQKIKENIDTKPFLSPTAQLQQRTWLIHWALFPLFNHEAARDTILELFFSPNFINTIQTSCPWVLRYLAAAVITSKNRSGGSRAAAVQQKQFKDLVRVVKQELYEYKDPITEFIAALHLDFDFEEAQKKLGEAEEVLKSDFFLLGSAEAFVESARHLISEAYCRIHQRIDIKDLSQRLNLSQDEGEKWIVNLIRDTRVDAKIDYKNGTVIMNHPPQSVYQQVIEKTKGGFFRTQVLHAAVTR